MRGPWEFVGREAELDRLRALLAGAKEGRSATLCLFGPPGQGKTALLEHFCQESSDVAVVRATGVEAEAEVPFGTLDAVARPLLEHLDVLPPAQRQALEAALALSEHGTGDPLAIGAGTLSLLAAAADRQPLLCLVDDLHWVDAPSRQALLFAARRLHREAIALVFALRGDDAPVLDMRGFEAMRVGPLGEGDCVRILGGLSAGRLPEDVAMQLVGAASGNPLTLLELTARLTPGQLAGREPLFGPPPPNASAQELLAERVAALPGGTAEALLVVTTSEDPDVEVLGRALAGLGLTLDHLVPAEDQGLVQLRAGRLQLRHPLVRSVSYHGATPQERRRAHAAIAAALPADHPRRAWHRAAAATAPDEEIAGALEAEAGRVRLRGGYLSSARTRVRAADMTPDRPRRVARLLEATHDFELGGEFPEAQRVLRQALEIAGDPAVLARIRGVEASLVLRGGRPREAREALLEQARALARAVPRSSARFFLQAGFASMALGEPSPWEEHTRTGLALVPEDDASTRAVGTAQLAAALVAAARLEEAEPLLAQVERELLARGDDDPVGGAVEVYALMARALVWIERFDAADRILGRLERDARRLSIAGGLPYVLTVRAFLDVSLGRWSSAEATITEQVSLASDTGDALFTTAGHAMRAYLAALRGRDDECLAAARAATEGSPSWGLPPAVPQAAQGLLALGRGEIDTAVDLLQPLAGRSGYPEPGSRAWEPDLIEALVRTGDLDAARRRLAVWEADGERTGRAHARATAARCRGLLVDDAELDATFEVALRRHDGVSMPFDRARTLLCLGERLRRARRRADARAPLRDALATFEELGAADWATRARTELRATGGAVPARTRPELGELTPHEIQVALLVAEGKTNREVAGALFLAPKTIEHHLSAIFRKLDIKRRTELARVFAADLAVGTAPDP